jgi:hypothetical protein
MLFFCHNSMGQTAQEGTIKNSNPQQTVLNSNKQLRKVKTPGQNQKKINSQEPRPLLSSARKNFYTDIGYFSFADEVLAKVNGVTTKALSVFSGYNLGFDVNMYFGRFIFIWNLHALSGFVDIERVGGVTYPRKSFTGAQTGPEFGYRLNPDFDVTWALNLLYRDIDVVGQSMALSNHLNIRFRLSPNLTFCQSFGNYGKPKSYSYGIGFRWLL